MRFSWLHAIAFLLICCGAGAAQQNSLILKDDKDDPCSRFKLKILVPAEDSGNYNLRVQKPSSGIDPKIIWNPCPRNESQIAGLIIRPAPDFRGKFLTQPPPGALHLTRVLSEHQERFQSIGPQLPSAMEMMRRRN